MFLYVTLYFNTLHANLQYNAHDLIFYHITLYRIVILCRMHALSCLLVLNYIDYANRLFHFVILPFVAAFICFYNNNLAIHTQ